VIAGTRLRFCDLRGATKRGRGPSIVWAKLAALAAGARIATGAAVG